MGLARRCPGGCRSSSRSSCVCTPSSVACVGCVSCRYPSRSSTKCGSGSETAMAPAMFGLERPSLRPARSVNGTIKPSTSCPARCSWSPRRSATSKTSPPGRCGCCARSRSSPPKTRGGPRICWRATRIATPTTSLHEHNEQQKTRGARRAAAARREHRARVGRGHADGLGSRAAHLIRAAIDAGIRVEPIPGPSAVLAALAASGLPDGRLLVSRAFHRLGQKTERGWFERLRAAGRHRRFLRGAPPDHGERWPRLLRVVGDVQVVVGTRTDQGPRRIGQRTNF